MRGDIRGWMAIGVIGLAVLAAILIGQQKPDSPEHSTNSDAANGASAVMLYASAMGHPTHQVTGSFEISEANTMLFVFTPTSPYTSEEADATARWVHDGGVIVYASEQGDPELDTALTVNRFARPVPSDSADANGPFLDGVRSVAGGTFALPFGLGARQVAVLRSGGLPIAYEERFGRGLVIALADPLELCNGYLEKADNGRFLADLLGLVPAGAPVVFDEYHHGLTASDITPAAWILTPWGAALLWLIVAIFFGLLLRGRRFGPLVPRPAEASRLDAEWAVAVGELLRRAGARAVTLGVLARASERAVAMQTGLPVEPRERFWQSLWQRAPDIASDLDSAERALYGSEKSEKDLLAAAQRLHGIAYPVSEEGRRRPRQ
ncbi:MAG: hypothetical protein AUI15_24125 [Actinobacteria bacterium 13_2_20CM_2_66_6]|nr:MAG: hypothetical protein AUI15_24125 [Actinobacteria bacterium 13_2_20CM_2_66_6]